MKKIVLLAVIFLLAAGSVSCNDTIIDIVPTQFDSIEGFIDAVKRPEKHKVFDFKSITCYYRPKNLPEGAALSYIEVGQTHIEFAYTYNADKKSDDRTKLMTFRWFRTFKGYSDAFIEVEMRKRNGKEVKLKDGREGTKYVADYTFSESKALNSEDRPAWFLNWVQDGECFSGWIPYTISEDDIAKYLEMEKVIIE